MMRVPLKSAINPFRSKPPSPMGSSANASPGSIDLENHQGLEYHDGHAGHGRVESTSSLNNHALVSPGGSVTPPPGVEDPAGAVSASAIEEAKANVRKIVNEKLKCDRVINNDSVSALVDESKALSPEVVKDAIISPDRVENKEECSVPAAPPSELKYGDRLRLWAR